jgi:hypothetical protein
VEYEDFSIRIEPDESQSFRVLISSPAGQGRSTFLSPFSPERLIRLWAGLARATNPTGVARELGSVSASAPEQERPETVGRKLFDALLTGHARTLFERSLGLVYGPPRRGLRIRLHLEPGWPEVSPLCTLPWEFLCADDGDFFNLDRLTPVVRYLDVDRPAILSPLSRTLQVLVVSSGSREGGPLDLEKERDRIQAAFGDREGVSMTVIAAKREVLERELHLKSPHIIHFMGHGQYEEAKGEGALLFETEFVSGPRLAALLKRSQHPPALVVLNACNTAAMAGGRVLNPFAGVATALVKAGFLAVIAMQFPITDEAAITFSGTLYEQLAAGEPVDAAVAEARLAVHGEYPDRGEWGTPVLFLRAPNGRLFDVSLIPLEEKSEAKRFLGHLSEAELRAVLASVDPWQDRSDLTRDGSLSGKVERLLDAAARRGEDNWLALLDQVLRVHSRTSPFSPFEGSLEGWMAQPESCWQAVNGRIVGLGEDPERFFEPADLARCSLLSWQGVRFRDGCIASRIWAPLLDRGGAVGLFLRNSVHACLLGIIRRSGKLDACLELWVLGSERLSLLRSALIPLEYSGWYDLVLALEDRLATLHSGGVSIEHKLDIALMPGYPGLLKFGDATAHYHRLKVSVGRPITE